MFRHSTKSASPIFVPIAALIFSLSLAGVAAAQSNTSLGTGALFSNTTGNFNTATGLNALLSNSTGANNTATGLQALLSNTTGTNNTATGANALFGNTTGIRNNAQGGNALSANTIGQFNNAIGFQALTLNTTGSQNNAHGDVALFSNTTGVNNTAFGDSALTGNTTGIGNTAIGAFANVSAGNLTNATAIGSFTTVNASNKIRLGNTSVAVLESQVTLTVVSDKTKKENFQPVDGEAVLGKIRGFELSSWNFIGHDSKEFRHYGPMAQDFFAAFGQDGVGQIGSETTINSGDLAGDSYGRRAGAGEAHSGIKTEGGAGCGASIEDGRNNSEVRLP